MTKKQLALEVIERLKREYPDPAGLARAKREISAHV